MTGIHLASVVAFLRPRGALGVLEGAPYFHRSVCPHWIYAHRSTDAISESHVLYLGSGDVCPAAEGWAARVLAMARGYDLLASPYFLHFHDGLVVLLGYAGGDMADLGIWRHPELPSPAARLAAVLRYEMERAK